MHLARVRLLGPARVRLLGLLPGRTLVLGKRMDERMSMGVTNAHAHAN